MNVEASQDGSQRGQLLFRRTSAACNMLSDKLQHVRIHSEGSTSQLCAPPPPPGAAAAGAMSQDGGPQLQRDPSILSQQPSQQLLMRGLTIDTTRYPSQSDMACTPDYATPVEQQFHVDYDIGAACQNEDQESRSPAKSPVRHIKRPRHAAGAWPGLEERESEVNSQPSQSQSSGRSQGDGPSTSSKQQTQSGCTFSLPPVAVPPRNKSRFARPHSPATFKNPFLTGGDPDQQHCINSSMPKQLPLVSSLHIKFKVHKEIGSGSFSRVVRATHRLSGLDYAIKRCRDALRRDSDRNRWLQEVQAHAAVGAHPNVVQYFDAWAEPDMEGDMMYIQLELCQESLGSMVATTKDPWRELELIGLMKQMASALAHIHAKGMVHLDVKPDNIYSGLDGAYKLGDFGMATLKHGHWHVEEGDARYLSGELLQGRTSALDKADIFALGASLYELASGSELPKSGPVYQRLRQGKITMLPTFTTQFLNVIKTLMHEDPAQRPSAEAILKLPLCCKAQLPMASVRRTSV
ncbi:wee1 kinase [Raphidocelis subcapitata]|uniref:Wee1 kinase n=1 Tax=Raphidocelis subcapitata TaxID=307507 RepID=A0A2V0NNQ1_9CHLO|nr:wee1 kinase [Raphidocelis subcapitata]|eukprot:GBF88132.1 wee1 kinase [Raphidocelis subcapitata]